VRVEISTRASVFLASFAFQACLIDRSSISPSLESTVYERPRTIISEIVIDRLTFFEH